VRPRSSLYFSAKGIASQSSLALKLVNKDIAAQDIGIDRSEVEEIRRYILS
jgi:hypothetical protein